MKFNTILIRYGETFLKKGKRPFFISVLKHNILRALNDKEFNVHEVYGFLSLGRKDGAVFDLSQEIQRVMNHTFGIQSYSPAITLPLEISAIEKAFDGLDDEIFQGVGTFRVSATRSFKTFPINSMELNRRLGAIVIARRGLKVNLTHPDLDLGLLIHQKGAFLFPGTWPGLGGLPVGTSGRAVLLLSGGIDSPVAGLMVMKRGVHILPVTFQCLASGSQGLKKTKDLAGRLSDFQGETRLMQLNATAWKRQFVQRIPSRYRLVILRRFMLRVAQRISTTMKPALIVTGDSIGQVASQTVENLITTQAAIDAMVVRPLAGFDKIQTMDAARKYGTYAISIRPVPDCCVDFTPKHPETRATPESAAKVETKLNVDSLVDEVIKTLQITSLPNPREVTDTLLRVYYRLRLLYGHRNWWPGDTPFEVIVGAVLTQNTAWSNVEKAIDNLKKQGLLEPGALIDARESVLEDAIRPTGYFRVKTKRLKAVVRALVEKGGPGFQKFKAMSIDAFRDFLLNINGVGPETADSILLYAFNRPVFVVDAYTRRILTRIGLLNGKENYGQIQEFMQANLPVQTDLYNDFHAQVVNLAKDFCKTKPVCDACPMEDFCSKKW